MGGSREFCIEDENGHRDDASLHDEILTNDTAEQAVIRATRERLIAAGADRAEIEALYPLD